MTSGERLYGLIWEGFAREGHIVAQPRWVELPEWTRKAYESAAEEYAKFLPAPQLGRLTEAVERAADALSEMAGTKWPSDRQR